MFQVEVFETGGLIEMDLHVRALLNWAADLSSLKTEIRTIVQETNKEERLAGLAAATGSTQVPLKHLAASTLKRRKGSPIPFVEHGSASRVIANLVVHVETGLNRLDVAVDWMGMPWLRYHVQPPDDPGRRMPYRPFAYISPWAIPLIDAAVVAESDRQFPSMTKKDWAGRARGIEEASTERRSGRTP